MRYNWILGFKWFLSAVGKRIRKTKIFRRVGNLLIAPIAEKLHRTPVVAGPEERLHLGRDVNLSNAILNTRSGEIWIGDGSFIGHGSMVITGTHDLNVEPALRAGTVPRSGNDIVIGNNVWIGSGAIVLGPSKIGDAAVVGAGALVKGDVSAGSIVVGVPARPVKPRSDPL